MMAQNKPNKPTIELKCWPYKVAIWEQRKRNEAGKEYVERSACLSKSFRRQDHEEWEEQKISVFSGDILLAVLVLQKAADVMLVDAHAPR